MKRALSVGMVCLCCMLMCSSCNTISALRKKVPVSESIEHTEEYEEALKALAEEYAYEFIIEEMSEGSSTTIGQYTIQIDDLSKVNIRIYNSDGVEGFNVDYSDQLTSLETKLRGYNEILIHSLVDMANCLSGKEFSYDRCYEFLQKSHSLNSQEHGMIEHGHLNIDFWEEWMVTYSLWKDWQNMCYKEEVSFWGNTKASTW